MAAHELSAHEAALLAQLAVAGDRLQSVALDMWESGWNDATRKAVTDALGAVSLAEGLLVGAGVVNVDEIQLARDVASANGSDGS
jgi:hypothetical protein